MIEEDRKLLTLDEVVTEYGFPRRSVEDNRWRKRVGLPIVKIGRRVFIDPQDVEDLIERSREVFPEPE